MKILFISNHTKEIQSAISIAKDKGAFVHLSETIESGIEYIRNARGCDIIFADIQSVDVKILKTNLLSEKISKDIIACGITSDSSKILYAIKNGAKDYISLPPNENIIAAILSELSLSNKKVIYQSSIMEEIMLYTKKIASSDASVLLTGQSGTGKEVLASYIHENSNRKSAPFVKINCAAIPENLLESELFGHEKGAFTGAIARKIGKFEEANGGTLLLDEISEMDIKLQAKLLRAIQEKEIDRVGGSSPVKVNIRIIATSNRDLASMVFEGKFREDLYYRLNVITIEIPNLASRLEDIKPLSEYFLLKYSKHNEQNKKFTQDALEKLQRHSWPGNVRELENTIHRAVLLSEEDISSEYIIFSKTHKVKSLREIERDHINNIISMCLGNAQEAATILGVTISELQQKIKQYELS